MKNLAYFIKSSSQLDPKLMTLKQQSAGRLFRNSSKVSLALSIRCPSMLPKQERDTLVKTSTDMSIIANSAKSYGADTQFVTSWAPMTLKIKAKSSKVNQLMALSQGVMSTNMKSIAQMLHFELSNFAKTFLSNQVIE